MPLPSFSPTRYVSKKIGEAYCHYQPYKEGVYPLFVCARPGRLIAKVERHTYFELPVTYRTESDYLSYATHTLSGRWPGSNLECGVCSSVAGMCHP